MAHVHVTGWREGMRKVSTTHALRAHLGLSEAKSITDRILDGGAVRLDGDEAAEALAAALRELGVEAAAGAARGLRSGGADPDGGG